MLELVFGGAGCGKTYFSRAAARDDALAGGRPVLIVPEQFSLESERAMLTMLGAEKAGLVSVYSFSRLAELLLSEDGAKALPRLDDCGRAAAMCVALSGLGDRLELYKSSRSSAYIDHMLDAVKEFKLYSVTPDMLLDASAKTTGTLRSKLSELSLVCGAYDAVIAGSAADPLDDITRLAFRLDDRRIFEGRTVIIDSFRSFTGQQLGVIDRIISQSRRCVVTICAESSSGDPDSLFAPSLRTAEKLRQLAKKHSVPITAPVYLGKRYRFSSEALETVEESVFRYDSRRTVYDEATDALTVCEARDRADEAEYCAAECRRLLREENYRCRDIAVIARSEEAYSALIEDAMEQQGLPCFIDRRINTSCGAPMQLVNAALDCAVNGISTDGVIRLLKTRLIDGASDTDIAELENYCFVWNVKGRSFGAPFTRSPEGFGADTGQSGNVLERINALRQRVYELITGLSSSLDGASGRDMAAGVFRFLEECGAAQALERSTSRMEPALAAEQEQLWSALIGLLDQIALLIGEAHISPADFAALMDIMISRCDIGHIPRGLDEITFGGADRIRVTAPKAVFVLGAVDGEFPAAPSGAGVFTDEERKRLAELDLPVADDAESELLNERLLVYTTLASASERLYAVYPTASENGAAQPSECVSELLKCVPRARFIKRSAVLSLDDIEAPAAAFDLAARNWLSGSDTANALKYSLFADEKLGERFAALADESADRPPEIRDERNTRELFGDSIYLSASRLETFYTCRFRFLCRYGLKLRQRRKAQLDAPDYGTAAHYVLERVFRENASRPLSELTDFDTVRELAERLLEEHIAERIGTGAGGAELAALLYRIRRMKTPLAYLIINIAQELSSGDFVPRYFELEPEALRLSLPDGTAVTLTGKIDRVDRCEIGGKSYLRVIDYKTGTKSFRISDVLAGLDMQMIIYLSLLTESGGSDRLPAGILYCPAVPDTITGARGMSRYDIIAAQRSGLRRDGIVIDDTEALEIADAMENGLSAKYLPVKLGRDGHPSDSSTEHIISSYSFSVLKKYVRYKIMSAAGELRSAGLAPSPVDNGYDICGSCPYRAVCRHPRKPSKPEKLDNAHALGRMLTQLTAAAADGMVSSIGSTVGSTGGTVGSNNDTVGSNGGDVGSNDNSIGTGGAGKGGSDE